MYACFGSIKICPTKENKKEEKTHTINIIVEEQISNPKTEELK